MGNSNNNKRAFLGVALVIIGLILVLSNFHVFPIGLRSVFFSWQGILVLVGIFLLFSREGSASGWILILIGGLFMVPHFWDISWSFRQFFWPALLVGLGAIMITRGIGQKKHPTEQGMDYIDEVAIFGGGDRVISSQNFRGGRLTAIFGGAKYNLTQAQLAKGRNEVDILTIFGGAKFIIPPDWEVKIEVTSIFGGFSDKRAVRKTDIHDPSRELIIKGVAIFGGGDLVSF